MARETKYSLWLREKHATSPLRHMVILHRSTTLGRFLQTLPMIVKMKLRWKSKLRTRNLAESKFQARCWQSETRSEPTQENFQFKLRMPMAISIPWLLYTLMFYILLRKWNWFYDEIANKYITSCYYYLDLSKENAGKMLTYYHWYSWSVKCAINASIHSNHNYFVHIFSAYLHRTMCN